MRNETRISIDNLMEELRQVIKIAKEEEDINDLFSFTLAELETIFKKEAEDVSVLELWGTVRLS